MSNPEPEISVVIPTRDREGSLLTTLKALSRQTLEGVRFEVIVVIDAADNGLDAGAALGDWPFSLSVSHSGGGGAAAARNRGAEIARAGKLVFLDDDIEASPVLLEQHLTALERDRAVVSIGQSAPLPGSDFLGAASEAWWLWVFDRMRDAVYRFGFDDVMSGNLGISRELFSSTGGFDENLACREDYEFGYRLLKGGAKLRYTEAAKGHHHEGITLARSLSRAQAEAVADVQIIKKHPELMKRLMIANLAEDAAGARVLRLVLFHVPVLGSLCRSVARHMLPVAEMLRLRRVWSATYRGLRLYTYYRAVAEEMGSKAALFQARAGAQAGFENARILEIDLSDGEGAASTDLRSTPFDGLVVSCFDTRIAEIEALPGFEPLEPKHVSDFLDHCRSVWGPLAMTADAIPSIVRGESGRDSTAGITALDLDTSQLDRDCNGRARILVRKGRRCLGTVDVSDGRDLGSIRRAILGDKALCGRIAALQFAPERTAPASGETVSLVICTRDRTENLARCLDAVSRLHPQPAEILIVDNAPATEATRDLVRERPELRYVREDIPGLDNARNKGISEARHSIVVFTDDDTRPDPHWIASVIEAFSDPGTSAVTGLVVPMSLDTPARRYFEDVYGGMGKGYAPRVFDKSVVDADRLLWASACGVGANMAFRRSALGDVGPFDPVLDVGTATRGGGDVEMFFRLISAGHRLVYVPDALVWHEHRDDWQALEGQLYDNGSGFAAYLARTAEKGHANRGQVLRFAAFQWIWPWLLKRLLRPGMHKRRLVLAECRGAMAGMRRLRTARREMLRLGLAAEDEQP